MPFHYQTFKTHLAADIAASQGYTASNPIRFGRVVKPITNRSHAVVATSVGFEPVGRATHEVYSFSIALRYLESEVPTTQDNETFLMEKALAFVQRFAPVVGDPEDMPVYENYAGIGFENFVTAVEPTDGQEADADVFVTVVIDCTVKATVYR
jgi:hypothetical protein